MQRSASGIKDVVDLYRKLDFDSRTLQTHRRTIQRYVPSQSFLGMSHHVKISDEQHWYTGEGMDEMEFTEAESNMHDLVSPLGGSTTNDRLLNTNNIKMPQSRQQRSMMKNHMSRKLRNKDLCLRYH